MNKIINGINNSECKVKTLNIITDRYFRCNINIFRGFAILCKVYFLVSFVIGFNSKLFQTNALTLQADSKTEISVLISTGLSLFNTTLSDNSRVSLSIFVVGPSGVIFTEKL